MRLRNDFVHILPDKDVTDSAVLVQISAQREGAHLGTVLGTGPGLFLPKVSKRHALEVHEGDRVALLRTFVKKMHADGFVLEDRSLICSEDEILWVEESS